MYFIVPLIDRTDRTNGTDGTNNKVVMPVTELKLDFSLIRLLLRETMRGKSIARTLMNHAVSQITASGAILDLGSKSDEASYNRFLNKTDGSKMTYTDIVGVGENVVRLDLEKPFSLADASYDTVTCFNTLEHIYDYQNVVRESRRILKTGGMFVGGTPFLVNFHPDPHDYFRYTDEALEKMFVAEGFVLERMVMLGFGPLTAGAALFLHVFPKFLRPLVVLKAVLLDAIILKYKANQRMKYPLGYVYVFRKSDDRTDGTDRTDRTNIM